MKSIFAEIARAESTVKVKSFEPIRLRVLESFKDYVLGGSYFNYCKKREFLENAFEPDYYSAKQLGVSEMAIRKVRSQISGILCNQFGDKVIDRILYGDAQTLKTITNQISLAEYRQTTKELFPDELCEFVNRNASDKISSDYSLSDLKPEMDFLRRCLIKSMKVQATSLDMDKLAYIFSRVDNGVLTNELDFSISEYFSVANLSE